MAKVSSRNRIRTKRIYGKEAGDTGFFPLLGGYDCVVVKWGGGSRDDVACEHSEVFPSTVFDGRGIDDTC